KAEASQKAEGEGRKAEVPDPEPEHEHEHEHNPNHLPRMPNAEDQTRSDLAGFGTSAFRLPPSAFTSAFRLPPSAFKSLALGAMALAIGLALAAPQVLPALELSRM